MRPLKHAAALALAVLLPAGAAQAAEGDTTTVYISGVLVDAPDCTVNGNNLVDVDFGNDIVTRQVDGLNYKTRIPFDLVCDNLASRGLRVAITGTPAAFGSGLLSAGKDGLAIQLWSGGDRLANAAPLSFTYPDAPALWATPVAQDNTTLTAGTFSSTASLVLSYQ